MRGIGGPLLTIGDLLSDVGEESTAAPEHHHHDTSLPSPSSILVSNDTLQSLDLIKLFQENYEKLNEALASSDHSWTALTLQKNGVEWIDKIRDRMVKQDKLKALCTALETANKLVQSTDTNVRLLSEKVRELEKIIKRGDSAVTAARTISVSLNQKGGSSVVGSQNREKTGSPQ